mmetsp:Transcript_44900/g.54383  ORF Transcript_44900/g.54383 Transcript_44900/m.54383 type:complete len:751 (-) Transcript_44900:124-2376(-)|eukprot:CAMPEP_0172510124 /NCGR_PEP_ID=MMETSP1066-20121228/226386_1 /TAXON_ID=671091 /ORGANISM="Coscinodiscus wailesii, Strain CCMP2513" /LENGTH=750 /DNA_ID=CAMNT_0013288965 /DNA_START=116 /DNA_END=2368 /DNA_ORIENTATION=+
MSTTVVVERVDVFTENEFGVEQPEKPNPLLIFGRHGSANQVTVKGVLYDTGAPDKLKKFPDDKGYILKKFPDEPPLALGYPEAKSNLEEKEEVLSEADSEDKVPKEVEVTVKSKILPPPPSPVEEEEVEEEVEEDVKEDTKDAKEDVEEDVEEEEKKSQPEPALEPLLESTIISPGPSTISTYVPPITDEEPTSIAEEKPTPIVIKKRRYFNPDVSAMSKTFAATSSTVRTLVTDRPTELVTDTPEAMSSAINEMYHQNESTLDAVFARLDRRVISGYTYSIDGNLPSVSIKATPVRNIAGDCLEVWEAPKTLRSVPDVFNDSFDFTFRTADDVRRVNREVMTHGTKLADYLPDRTRLRMILKRYEDNMMTLCDLVEEIDRITKDLPDEGSASLEADMARLKKVFDRIQTKMTKIKMSVQCTQYDGYDGIIHEAIDFETVDTVSRRSTLKAHASAVSAVVYYSWEDKPRLASGSRDHAIKLWDLTNNTVTMSLDGHEGVVNGLAYYEVNGEPRLVSGSFDQTIKLWDLTNGACLGTLTGHEHYVYALTAYTVDGVNCLASACCSGDVHLWNLDTMELVATLEGETSSAIYSITSFSEDGELYIASGGADETVTIWSEAKREPLNQLSGHTDAIRSLVTYEIENTSFLASGSADGTIKIWDMSTGELMETLKGHEGSDISLATTLHREAPMLVSGDETGAVKFWNLELGVCIKTVRESGPVKSLVMFLDEQRPHVAVGNDFNSGRIDLLSE